jgi:Protein of unknown function (DUF2797)
MADDRLGISVGGRLLLAGYGHGERGPYLVVDDLDRAPWQRQTIFVREQTFTLTRCEERHCVGRHDLETGRSSPCPERASLRASYEQCSDCFVATGFNPAFYNTPRISHQQRQRNLEPHVVYVVSFGPGALKVGMTYAPRRLSRLLEQGARLGSIVAELPSADRARELEASIAGSFDASEFVRTARKRQLLGVPLSIAAARAELAALLARVVERHPDVARRQPIVELDGYYLGARRLPASLIDLSETEPHSISGRCIGMIGDVLIMTQGDQYYMLSVGDSVGHRLDIEPRERENRFVGQLGLPF